MADTRTPDEIWSDDLLDRRKEAELLIAYIESVAVRQIPRQDAKAYSIAVDAGYGEGKSFFLRRLAENLEINHPVAFVDAWSDDLADEPLTALVATLKKALKPLLSETSVKSHWDTVVEKTGKVAKIAAVGLAKRGLGLLMTGAAVEAAENVLTEVTEESKAVIKEVSGEVADNAIAEIQAGTLMNERISRFEEGQQAILDLKASLRKLVGALSGTRLHAPIIIVIDELDRCRPTYAIKLLEEIKHLFDVPGLVFVFGMHGDQLAHSISGSYGATFDGQSYLRRFINRRYVLRKPDLGPLVARLLKSSQIDVQRLSYPFGSINAQPVSRMDVASVIAKYIEAHGLAARDAYQFIDILQTCAALTKDSPLLLPYLAPLIASRMRGLAPGTLDKDAKYSDLYFRLSDIGQATDVTAMAMAERIQHAAPYSDEELSRQVNRHNDDAAYLVMQITMNGKTNNNRLAHPRSYPELLETVGRFKNPEIDSPDRSA